MLTRGDWEMTSAAFPEEAQTVQRSLFSHDITAFGDRDQANWDPTKRGSVPDVIDDEQQLEKYFDGSGRTEAILRERERCMCPRLGDAYTRASKADEIPGVRLQTNNSIYGTGKPFKEFVTVKEKKPDLF